MRIGIISDTHDHVAAAKRAIDLLSQKEIDMLCHLGDWVAPFTVEAIATSAQDHTIPLRGVLGNNDGEVFGIVQKNPDKWGIDLAHHTLSFTAGGKSVVLYHGTDEAITDALVQSNTYDAVFAGHTHVPEKRRVGSTILINPGTLSGFSFPRGGEITVGECAIYDTQLHETELINFPL